MQWLLTNGQKPQCPKKTWKRAGFPIRSLTQNALTTNPVLLCKKWASDRLWYCTSLLWDGMINQKCKNVLQCQREWRTKGNVSFFVLHSESLNLHRNESETLHYRTLRFRSALSTDETELTKEFICCLRTSDECDVKRSGSDLYGDWSGTCAVVTAANACSIFRKHICECI